MLRPITLPARLRPTLRVESIVLIVMAYLVATANGPWWSAIAKGRSFSEPNTWLLLAACFSALVALHFVLVAVFTNRWTVKPLLTVLLVATAATAHFMRTYAVLLDSTMLQNIVNTDLHETRELISWSLIGDVLAWSLVPVAFVWLVQVDRRPWLRSLGFRAACMVLFLAVGVLSILSVSRDLLSQMRNQPELRYLITPGNYLYGLTARGIHGLRSPAGPRSPIGMDAHLAASAVAGGKPKVLVLVLGETARAANFSLLGYARSTNPELSGLDVVAFGDMTSCGTATEVSVPCMFSPYGREDYDERRIRQSEGLLDVLVHAGYAVKWGAGIDYRKLDAAFAPELCDADECFDEILVKSLDEELATVRGNTVVVLHMMGNHGPAYYRRYPQAFRQFRPDCQTATLRDCDRAEVVNAYDNAIRYTDHVLAEMVESLREHSADVDGALLYVSDHGESLGESGLYLHGIPYAIAPDLQTRVPMIAWVSDGFANSEGLARNCMRQAADLPASHDNLFDTVLGLMTVETVAYRPDRDLLHACRAVASASFAGSTSTVSRRLGADARRRNLQASVTPVFSPRRSGGKPGLEALGH
jgi:lipid A ethanolaminephosphotransferase